MITDEQVKIALCAYLDDCESMLKIYPQLADQMRDALEAYEQSKWVSVKDRLPERDGFYLTDDGLCFFHFDNAFEEDDYWVYAYNPEESANVAVWQLIPELMLEYRND